MITTTQQADHIREAMTTVTIRTNILKGIVPAATSSSLPPSLQRKAGARTVAMPTHPPNGTTQDPPLTMIGPPASGLSTNGPSSRGSRVIHRSNGSEAHSSMKSLTIGVADHRTMDAVETDDDAIN